MAVSKQALLTELQKRKKKSELPKFDFEKHCFPKQVEFFQGDGPRFRVACCSRRAGKCREINTLVKTPTGSVKIQNLKRGDIVYGYDSDGVVRECKVTQLHDQGIKEVVDLIHSRKIVATSTVDHKWLAHNTHKNERKVKRLKDFNSRDKIAEEYYPIPGGTKEVKEAYAIGALLGDGCSRSEGGVVISSDDKVIVEKCAKVLEASSIYKRKHNYSWSIKGLKHTNSQLHFYNLWCRDRYAYEKIIDIKEVRTWNRKSQLELLAGLIDTDGSVCITKDGRLHIRLSMQAKAVIEGCQMLILDLFQYKPQIITDSRDKYKNGPVYNLSISNNKYSKRILKELPTITERKKWKPEYKNLKERNSNEKYTGVKLGKPRKAQCYDITIDNDTHLYLDANGLIGHNTVGIVADMFDVCLKEKDSLCLYITVTKNAARDIIWADIEKIVEDYKIDCKLDQSKLSVKFPNRSKILIEGAKDISDIEKHRGKKLKRCYIDEAQSFRSYIRYLVNEIITPALRDLKGNLYVTGTPGPTKAGYFYEITQSDFWHNVHWTAFDNIHMHDPPDKDLEETLAEERQMKEIEADDPGYIRETYGKWIEDLDALVFKFNKEKNIYLDLPTQGEWTYIMGVDIGYEDSDAIAVLGYNSYAKTVFLVDEFVKNKQTISELIKHIKYYQNEYNPVKIVMDAGALGKKIQEEIRQRHGIHMEAAEKSRKIEFIELLNDDMRTRKFKAFDKSLFQEDCTLVQWDKESRITNPEKPKISKIYHSDICDAVLYAWRECKHFLSEKPTEEVKPHTDKYMDKLEKEEAERMQRRMDDPIGAELEEAIEQDMEELDSILDIY